MSKRIQIKLEFDQDISSLMASKYPHYLNFRIISKSLDARGAPRGKKPHYIYQLDVVEEGESFEMEEELFQAKQLKSPPIIIGGGPAGLFAALRFSEYGQKTILIERGDKAHNRMLFISKYWKKGILNQDTNVCYGEGGAGLFSDGKLITRIKSPFIKYVMHKFVEFGAPAEVGYLSNPHLGSNKIRKIIHKITNVLIEKGHDIIYNDKLVKILFDKNRAIGVELSSGKRYFSEFIILATGHSSKEIYQHLKTEKVAMKPKDFAIGVRVEHPRLKIDKIQYGSYAGEDGLGTARYRLSYHNKTTEKGTYSFCMCPGGYVLSSGTDVNGMVVNGMSNYSRRSPWSNSALVVSVQQGRDFTTDDLLGGHYFQQKIEQAAYDLSLKESNGRALPAISVKEFMQGKLTDSALPKTSCPSGIFKADLRRVFPGFVVEHLKKALLDFDQKMPGFISDDALLIAPETRTSAPVSILRDKNNLESLSHKGLYPCGEGAGHAGGITSAAVDGIRICESIMHRREV